jgi:hypothetical protein
MKRHEELKHLHIKPLYKILLSLVFFFLLPSVILSYLFKKTHTTVVVLNYGNKAPFDLIYNIFKEHKIFNLIPLDKFFVPILPPIFIQDIIKILYHNPIFIWKNLYFFGAIALKISQYYFFVRRHHISSLIVFQEYSFYMSYFTRVMEFEQRKLYNIQHGISGETYCHFRFTKSFVWGKYFKKMFIENGADENQFILTGSFVHQILKEKKISISEEIDILYVMQGEMDEMYEVLEILDLLSEGMVIRYIQHPRYPANITTQLIPSEYDTISSILKSKLVLSHYSTVLFDSAFLGKKALSYTKKERNMYKYVSYLVEESIIHDKLELRYKILNQDTTVVPLDKKYIEVNKNVINIIKYELNINC